MPTNDEIRKMVREAFAAGAAYMKGKARVRTDKPYMGSGWQKVDPYIDWPLGMAIDTAALDYAVQTDQVKPKPPEPEPEPFDQDL